MASSPLTAPEEIIKSSDGSSSSPSPSASSPPSHSPPPSQSPPPSTPSKSPPPSAFHSSPPPSPPASSPPSPPPKSSPPFSPPTPSKTPAQSPPPNDPGSPSPPAISPPSPPTTRPPPPPPGAPPARVLSPPPSGSASANRSLGPSASPGTSTSSSGSDPTSNTPLIAGIVTGGIVILALFIVSLICVNRKKKQRPYADGGLPHQGGDKYRHGPIKHKQPPSNMDYVVNINPPPGGGWGAPTPRLMGPSNSESSEPGQHHLPPQAPPLKMGGYGAKSQFTCEELATATGGFSQANVLGQGGFGFVHKGVLPDGREVAVKSLKSGSGQGEREFQAEVEIISRVHHRHLVSLVGYCIASEKRMLVYEFVPNKTLEFHLHGKGQPVMDWATRLRIAVGSAKGIAYLHEDCYPRIIHRDIKSANILLDSKFEAMVADFGLAKLASDNFTHVSTRVMGTFGYLAPEYAASGKLTEKSDVFSFGVMLLELITGHRPVDPKNKTMEDSLVDWARPLMSQALEDGDYCKLADPRLDNHFVPQEMARMVACAAAAIRHSARRRPRMSQIVRALEGVSSLEDLNEGVKPGQSSRNAPPASQEVYDTRAYNADMMKFRKMVISGLDDNSSECPSAASSSESREVDATHNQKEIK